MTNTTAAPGAGGSIRPVAAKIGVRARTSAGISFGPFEHGDPGAIERVADPRRIGRPLQDTIRGTQNVVLRDPEHA